MKRFLVLFAAIALACVGASAQNPKEIELDPVNIILGNSFTWETSFPAGSEVVFDFLDSNEDDVVELEEKGNTVIIKGIALGTTKVVAICGDNVIHRIVNVVLRGAGKTDEAGEEEEEKETTAVWTGKYEYKAPKDNYYFDTGSFIYAKIGSILIEKNLESDGSRGYWKAYNLTTHKCKEYVGEAGFDHKATDGESLEPEEWEGLENFAPLDFFVDSEFYKSIQSDPANSLGEYYVGNEMVAGVECWVFDTDGYGGIRMKYWVDPANGCCLKYGGTSNAGTFRVQYQIKKYILHYFEWTPDVYDAIINDYL